MFMRKALLTVLLVSVIVFVSISFMGASCTVSPAPGPGTSHLIRLDNNSSNSYYLEIFESLTAPFPYIQKYTGPYTTTSAYANYGDYVQIYSNAGSYYLLLPPSFTSNYMFVNSGITFTIGSGGGWVIEER
jgi:hypothetical protein